MERKYINPWCEKCIDKDNMRCEGAEVKMLVGIACDFFRDVKSTKLTNPKDIIGSNKLPFHLCPTTFTAGVSMAFLEGCLKYGRSNFRAVGVRASIYYDAALRHLIAWFEGEDIDPDSGLNHLYKAGACLAVIADAMEAGKLNDDRMIKGGYSKLIDKFTPMIKELKEKHKDKNPKHYTIKDNNEENL